MSRTLQRYLVQLYLACVALTASAVLLVFLVIDFGDRLKLYVGARASDVLELYLCKIAVTTVQLMPAAMLLGAGIALTTLKRRGELDAMRSLGISPRGIVAPLLGCATVLGVGLSVFDERVAAPAGARIDTLMVERFHVWGDWRYYYATQQWLRLGPSVFRVFAADEAGIRGVTVFRLSPAFSLEQRVDAEAMRPLPDGAFELTNASIRDYLNEPHLTTKASEQTRFTLADAKAFAIKSGRPEQMSSRELAEQERLRATAGLPTVRYALARHGRYSQPLLGAAGALLACALALRRGRRPALTVALVEGLGVSAALWGLVVVGRALSLSERVAAPVGAWLPLVALLAAGVLGVRRVERSA
ncbi:MAG: LptF/LptG family permease [Myxococcaceae bacterium]|nr:LptF/LptG family permease [Myxococcaceae bacterium]